jgi:hypothetical protein
LLTSHIEGSHSCIPSRYDPVHTTRFAREWDTYRKCLRKGKYTRSGTNTDSIHTQPGNLVKGLQALGSQVMVEGGISCEWFLGCEGSKGPHRLVHEELKRRMEATTWTAEKEDTESGGTPACRLAEAVKLECNPS